MRLAESVGRGMKRFLIFLLLGPLIGLLVFMLRNAFAGKIVGGFMGFVFGLPFGYLFGLPIVLVMWVEDWFLSDKIGLGMKVATSRAWDTWPPSQCCYLQAPSTFNFLRF
jgi:hypothetical protein